MACDLATLPRCERCHLAQTRTQVVVGSGNPHATVMFIGEAPGRNEDEGGRPFIGAAGKILDQFLERAQLSRDEIYITNIIKCRPPKNRNPHKDEIEACRDWLSAQIIEQAPLLIVTLGACAASWVLGDDRSMSEIVKTSGVYEYSLGSDTSARAEVIAVYHPAATIYNQHLREPFLASAKRVREALNRLEGSNS